jgi:hypothetical protein
MKDQIINLVLAVIVTLVLFAALYLGSEIALP